MEIGDKISKAEKVSLHPQNLDEAIEWWDSGKSLFSIECGGLGPGYEQALQIAGMELVRGFKDASIDWEDEERMDGLDDEMNKYMWANPIVKKLGLSGAQAGAAKNIACVFIRNGWEKGLEITPKDRRIQISKNFP